MGDCLSKICGRKREREDDLREYREQQDRANNFLYGTSNNNPHVIPIRSAGLQSSPPPPTSPFPVSNNDFEIDLEELEHQRKMAELRRKNEENLTEISAKLDRLDTERELKRMRREEDDKAKLETMKQQMRMKSEQRALEASNQDVGTGIDLYAGERNRNRSNFEAQLAELREQHESNLQKHKRAMNSAAFESAQQENEHQRNLQQIEQEYQVLREHIYRNAEERAQKMSQQYTEIGKALQRMVWNAICEGNWTERLNMLRNSNEDSKKMEPYCLGRAASISKSQDWIQILKNLKKVMEDEAENMRKAYEFTGKSFLMVIKSSVLNVADKCANLISLLYSSENQDSIRRAAAELNSACFSIPTLAELKQRYYSEMRSNSAL